MNYKETIKQKIFEVLEKNFSDFENEIVKMNFEVSIPELSKGDFTSNICLVASKILKKSPKEIADKIIDSLNLEFVEKIEFVLPGFLNFWIKEENILEEFRAGNLPKANFPQNKNKKILLEHTSVNLFKPFTVGHMMSNFIGEFIKNVYKFSHADVVNLSYPSDKSIGIAKAIYIIKQDGGLEQEIFKDEKLLNEIIKYLGSTYVRGVAEFKKWEEENKIEKIQEVKNIANNIFNNIKGDDLKIFEYAKEKNIFYFQNFLQKLNSNFDEFIYESDAGEEGKRVVLENTGDSKVFQKSEGAIIYNPGEEKKDIPTLVYINSEGNPTYGAKDIGLINLKFKKYNPDLSIYIVDNEQNVHFKSVFDAMSKISKEYAEKSLHIAHGRMTFKGARMSSRLGGVPTGEEILSAVVDEVREKSSEKVSHMSEVEKEDLYRNIALASLKISILRSKAGVNIDFDPERATSFEGDSGPYLCYTYARCCSLLDKGYYFLEQLPKLSSRKTILSKKEELSEIERKAFQYSSILETVVNELASQKLVTYLFELAAEFNRFYAENKIIDEENIKETENMLLIVKVVSEVLKHGLSLLGIKAPEKM